MNNDIYITIILGYNSSLDFSQSTKTLFICSACVDANAENSSRTISRVYVTIDTMLNFAANVDVDTNTNVTCERTSAWHPCK